MKTLTTFVAAAAFAATLAAQQIYATFDVLPVKESKLALAANGVAGTVTAQIGDRVKAGELLMELDNREEKASVELEAANTEKARLAYEHAQSTYNRYTKLQDVIDEEQFDRIRFDRDTKKVEYMKAQKGLELAKARLSKTRLTAPFEGTITAKNVETGDGVGGVQPLYTLINNRQVKLLLSFDEKHWAAIKPGQLFEYQVDGLEGKRTGKIAKVYPTAHRATRKIRAELLTEGLVPGLFGDGFIKAR